MTLRERSPSTPMTTLSGDMKSLIAAPSLRNSGLLAISNSTSEPLFASSSRTMPRITSAVPTGTVLLVTSTLNLSIFLPKVRATAFTAVRSADPSSSGGVPTAQNTASTSLRHSSRDVVKLRRPAATFRSTSSLSPGSYIGMTPLCSASILFLSISTHVTIAPISAKQAPETRPT